MPARIVGGVCACARMPGEVVAELAANWATMWGGCEAARAAGDILARLEVATEAWGLSDVHVMSGGMVALVCCATSGGRDVVVKLNPRVAGSELLAAEGEALALWDGIGEVVKQHDRRDDGYTLQLERLCPGTRLEDTGLVAEDMFAPAAKSPAACTAPTLWRARSRTSLTSAAPGG